MSPRRPKTVKTAKAASAAPAARRGFPWKKTLLIAGAVLFVAAFLHSTGAFREMMAGPKTPLPRLNIGLSFGTELKDMLIRFPGAKDRAFNNDPQFRILTLKDRKDMPDGAAEAELIFFEGKLYFVSAKWDNDAAAKVPVESWAQQFRRWKKRQPSPAIALQGAGSDTVLNEWYFED
jgi:hypothetical protein